MQFLTYLTPIYNSKPGGKLNLLVLFFSVLLGGNLLQAGTQSVASCHDVLPILGW